jgi:hypothetical protein
MTKPIRDLYESIPDDMRMAWDDYMDLMELDTREVPAQAPTRPIVAPSATAPGAWTDIQSVRSGGVVDPPKQAAPAPSPVAPTQTGHDIWGKPAPSDGRETIAGRLFRAPGDTLDNILGKPHSSLGMPQEKPSAPPAQPPAAPPVVQQPPPRSQLSLPEVPHYSLKNPTKSSPGAVAPQPKPVPARQPAPARPPQPELIPMQTTPGQIPGNSAYIRQYMDMLRQTNSQRQR